MYKPEISQQINKGASNQAVYKKNLNEIHSKAVMDVTSHLATNKVLNVKAPEVAEEERKLSREGAAEIGLQQNTKQL